MDINWSARHDIRAVKAHAVSEWFKPDTGFTGKVVDADEGATNGQGSLNALKSVLSICGRRRRTGKSGVIGAAFALTSQVGPDMIHDQKLLYGALNQLCVANEGG